MVKTFPGRLAQVGRIGLSEAISLPLLVFALSRTLLLVVGFFAQALLPENSGITLWHAAPNAPLLDMWARWDSGFYLTIARDGYSYIWGEQSSVAFFPLYPLLLRLGAVLGSYLVAGVLVSNLCFLGGLIFLYKLTRLELGTLAARRSIWYLSFFPASFFFSSVYTESTFFLGAVAAYYFARTGRWGLASIFGLLTAATRVTGVVMFGVLGLEWLRANGFCLTRLHKAASWRALGRGLRNDWGSLLAICTVPLGLLSYMLFLNYTFADGLAFMTVQAAWARETLGPVAIVWRDLKGLVWGLQTGNGFFYPVLFDVSALIFGLIFGLLAWWRLGTAMGIFVLSGLLVPAASATQSLMRYTLVLFPVFMMLAAVIKLKWLHRAILLLFMLLLTLAFALHANWYFVS